MAVRNTTVDFEMIPDATWTVAEDVAITYAIVPDSDYGRFVEIVARAEQVDETELYFAASQILAERYGITVSPDA